MSFRQDSEIPAHMLDGPVRGQKNMTATPSTDGILARGLAFEYPGRTLWQDLSFTVSPGSYTVVVGESGSGKTTLLQSLGSLERPSTGALHVLGQEPAKLRGSAKRDFLRNKVGFSFQNAGVVASWTVKKNLEVGGYQLRDDPEWAREIFQRFSLPFEFINTPVYRLSGGEQQRVGIIRLALRRPPLLLMDEPTAALDDKNAQRVTDFLTEHCKAGGIAVVATHDARVTKHADLTLQL